MRQDFSDVSGQVLSGLFPVILQEHDPEWKAYYLRERDYLRSVFGESIIRVNHIGSSAVEGLIAKPTVDILLEIAKETDLPAITETLRDAGYVVNTPEGDIIMYLKGYTPRGFEGQAVHIHVRESGDWGELYFRDYLIAHPDAAKEYAEFKRSLKQRYPHDRDGYTRAKGLFVRKYTELARAEFPNRYVPAR